MPRKPANQPLKKPSDRAPQGIIVLVDVVLLAPLADGLCVLVHERPNEPFRGLNALPGGYVRPEEDRSAEHAARRILKKKIGIEVSFFEQLATYGGPLRDPGGWSISIAHVALIPSPIEGLNWKPVDNTGILAFDHEQMILDAVTRIRNRSAYSALPAHLAGDAFTLPQLQRVYEAVLGEKIDKVSFRRRMNEIGAIEPVEGAYVSGVPGPRAQLYRLTDAERAKSSVLLRGFGTR